MKGWWGKTECFSSIMEVIFYFPSFIPSLCFLCFSFVGLKGKCKSINKIQRFFSLSNISQQRKVCIAVTSFSPLFPSLFVQDAEDVGECCRGRPAEGWTPDYYQQLYPCWTVIIAINKGLKERNCRKNMSISLAAVTLFHEAYIPDSICLTILLLLFSFPFPLCFLSSQVFWSE